jgi:hypothetical protein
LLLAILRATGDYVSVQELFTTWAPTFPELAAQLGGHSPKAIGQRLRQYLEDQAQASPPPALWLVQYATGHKRFWKVESHPPACPDPRPGR